MEKIGQRESRTIEFKEVKKGQDLKSYLKTVSAYANYGTGQIFFGVNDDGVVCPVENPVDFCLTVENQINDSLDPIPDFSLSIEENGVVVLSVNKGEDTPYLYKGTAYQRKDSSSRPVDRNGLRRLAMDGVNISFENLPSHLQTLSFNVFSRWCQDQIGLSALNQDTLKTFQLFSEQKGYTNCALLLSDQNTFQGIDIVQFGQDHSTILDRLTVNGCSILEMFEQAVTYFESRYSYEKVEGYSRNLHFSIPMEAFREALANSLVHRNWDTASGIQIAFEPDQITITSPGGLPDGLEPDDYLNRQISLPRNQNLAIILNRLGLIEKFGTGIGRIKKSYSASIDKPRFSILENYITVELPVIKSADQLSREEREVLMLIKSGISTRQEIAEKLNLNVYQMTKTLKSLQQMNLIKKKGSTRNAVFEAAD